MIRFNDVVINVNKDTSKFDEKKEKLLNVYYQKKKDEYEV